MRAQPVLRPEPTRCSRTRRSMVHPHPSDGRASGGGTKLGILAVWTSTSSSGTWKDASRLRMAPPDWRAATRRVLNERPLRSRSTSKRTGSLIVPGRMK